jgi:hypothetical protein
MPQAESNTLVNNLNRMCVRTFSTTDIPPTGFSNEITETRAHDQFKENAERGRVVTVQRSNVAVKVFVLQLVHNRGVPCQTKWRPAEVFC